MSQLDLLKRELKLLQTDSDLLLQSRLFPLYSFIDSGRLIRAWAGSNHSIQLDGKHPLSRLIMLHEHFKLLLHAGPQLLVFQVSQI